MLQTNQANESVKKKPQISFSGKSISETDKQTKEQAGDLILSDEEIDNLLFEEIINWEEEDELTFEMPDWYQFYAIELGWGYAENPLGAAYNPQNSQFSELNFESFFLNQKKTQQEMLFYLFAEGKNFYELKSEEIAGLILSQFDYTYKPPGEKRSYGLRFQHTYFDQGMDFSELDSPPDRTKITSNLSEIAPNFKWIGENGEEGKFELNWSRERLQQFADRNSKFRISASLSNKSAKPVKWQGKIFHSLCKFKDRTPKDASGSKLEGNLETKHIGLSTRLSSASTSGWAKDLSLSSGIEKVKANTGGFYDYYRFKTSMEKKFETDNWESEMSAGYNRTRYSERLINNMELFAKDHWSFEVGLSRALNEYWKTYARWIHDSDRSNHPDYAFESNFWSFGMAWEK